MRITVERISPSGYWAWELWNDAGRLAKGLADTKAGALSDARDAKRAAKAGAL